MLQPMYPVMGVQTELQRLQRQAAPPVILTAGHHRVARRLPHPILQQELIQSLLPMPRVVQQLRSEERREGKESMPPSMLQPIYPEMVVQTELQRIQRQ